MTTFRLTSQCLQEEESWFPGLGHIMLEKIKALRGQQGGDFGQALLEHGAELALETGTAADNTSSSSFEWEKDGSLTLQSNQQTLRVWAGSVLASFKRQENSYCVPVAVLNGASEVEVSWLWIDGPESASFVANVMSAALHERERRSVSSSSPDSKDAIDRVSAVASDSTFIPDELKRKVEAFQIPLESVANVLEEKGERSGYVLRVQFAVDAPGWVEVELPSQRWRLNIQSVAGTSGLASGEQQQTTPPLLAIVPEAYFTGPPSLLKKLEVLSQRQQQEQEQEEDLWCCSDLVSSDKNYGPGAGGKPFQKPAIIMKIPPVMCRDKEALNDRLYRLLDTWVDTHFTNHRTELFKETYQLKTPPKGGPEEKEMYKHVTDDEKLQLVWCGHELTVKWTNVVDICMGDNVGWIVVALVSQNTKVVFPFVLRVHGPLPEVFYHLRSSYLSFRHYKDGLPEQELPTTDSLLQRKALAAETHSNIIRYRQRY